MTKFLKNSMRSIGYGFMDMYDANYVLNNYNYGNFYEGDKIKFIMINATVKPRYYFADVVIGYSRDLRLSNIKQIDVEAEEFYKI